MQAFTQTVKKATSQFSSFIGKGIPLALLALGVLRFCMISNGAAVPPLTEGRTLAGSMKWFEIEARKSLCTPSPVNRLCDPWFVLVLKQG